MEFHRAKVDRVRPMANEFAKFVVLHIPQHGPSDRAAAQRPNNGEPEVVILREVMATAPSCFFPVLYSFGNCSVQSRGKVGEVCREEMHPSTVITIGVQTL